MTRFNLSIALVAATALLSGCQKELSVSGQDNQQKDGPSFVATLVSKSETVKTAMGGNDGCVNWTAGDKVTLYEIVDGTLAGQYDSEEADITDGTPNTATFAVTVTGGDPAGTDYLYSVCYPAGKISQQGADYQFTIASSQALAEDGGFDPAADVLVSKTIKMAQRIGTDPLVLQFHRIGTVGKLTLKGIGEGEKIQNVKITLPTAVKVAGTCNVNLETAEYEIVSGKNAITLTSEAGIAAAAEGTAVYFRCLAGTWPKDSKIDFEVATDKNTYLKTVTLPEDYVFAEGGLTKIGVGDFTTVYNPNDYLSMYNNGIDFTICGEVINKKTYGDAQTLSADSIIDAFETTGIYFVDNSKSSRTWSYGGKRVEPMVDGTILIGRFRNHPQPVMKQTFETANQGCFAFNGDVKILNYRIEARDNSYGIFQGKKGLSDCGKYSLLFQDCTFINPYNYLTSFNNGTYAVPKTIMFDNCIIRVKGMVINGGSNASNKPEALDTLSFKNTVIAPYDATSATKLNGCLLNFGSTKNPTTALKVEMSYCTVYDYQPEIISRGMVEVKDYADFKMDHTAFYHSSYEGFDSNYYTIYGSQPTTLTTGGVSISACYSNTIDGQTMRHSGGNRSNLAPEDGSRTWSAYINSASQTVEVDKVQADKDYFPVSVIAKDKSMLGGASYDTKPWVLMSL